MAIKKNKKFFRTNFGKWSLRKTNIEEKIDCKSILASLLNDPLHHIHF